MTTRDKWESYLVAVINKDIGGIIPSSIRAILRALSYIYVTGVNIRVFLYHHGFLRTRRTGCLVISIGNLVVGGTGKTPVAEMFAKALVNGGRRVAILSRGYKSKEKKRRAPRVVSDGKTILLDVEKSGDEPFMLACNVPEAVVLVDKNRQESARFAVEKFGADTIILDDGYQYLGLSRQVNIVLIDCTNPFGNQRLLPRGTLREPIRHLNRANMFFLTKSEGMDLYALKKRLKALNPKAEIIECAHRPKYLNDVYSGTKKDLSWLLGRRIVCVSGIARPHGFEDALTKLGAVLVSVHRFPDHYMYKDAELIEIIKCAKQNKVEGLVTTQKDAVRFPKDFSTREFVMYYLRVEIEIIYGSKDFYDRIGRMCY